MVIFIHLVLVDIKKEVIFFMIVDSTFEKGVMGNKKERDY